MKPDQRFLKQEKEFWANVRTISEAVGYTDKKQRNGKLVSNLEVGRIKNPTRSEVRNALRSIGLTSTHIMENDERLTEFGEKLFAYFEYRANTLNTYVRPRLMHKYEAKELFETLRAKYNPTCPLPLNKQKSNKKDYAFLTCIINILVEANLGGRTCNYDPQQLTAVTRDYKPLRTLARRVDGAFPSVVDPTAVWEIKEYYNTTTFGSRIADGVYETLLDGIELEELREEEKIDVKHYLMIDSYNVWWGGITTIQEEESEKENSSARSQSGKSYLCRMIDMLHMGYIDEVLFGGREVVERLPDLVKEWIEIEEKRTDRLPPLAPETFTETEKTTRPTREIMRQKSKPDRPIQQPMDLDWS